MSTANFLPSIRWCRNLQIQQFAAYRVTRIDDSGGKFFGFYYNGVFYFYKRNVQGDIIGILSTGGMEVVTYQYDTWGKLLSTTGDYASTVGADNPLRYRGYY